MIPDDLRQQAVVGSPQSVADQIKTKVLDAGVDGVIIARAHELADISRGADHGTR